MDEGMPILGYPLFDASQEAEVAMVTPHSPLSSHVGM